MNNSDNPQFLDLLKQAVDIDSRIFSYYSVYLGLNTDFQMSIYRSLFMSYLNLLCKPETPKPDPAPVRERLSKISPDLATVYDMIDSDNGFSERQKQILIKVLLISAVNVDNITALESRLERQERDLNE